MMGWRGRIGWLVPPGNPTLEPEVMALTPTGVGMYFNRLRASGAVGQHEGQAERNQQQFDSVEDAATLLMLVRPQVLMVAHASLSTTLGSQREQSFLQRAESRFGVPVVTAMEAVMRALQHLDVKRLAYATPYDEAVTQAGLDYLAARGVSVVKSARLGAIGSIYDQAPSEAYRLGRAADHEQADAVFISGVGLPSLSVIDALEQDLQKPVITATVAMMWCALRAIGVRDAAHAQGILLRQN